jgi:hypothetical protein
MRPDHSKYPPDNADDYNFYIRCAHSDRNEMMARVFSWRAIAGLFKRVRSMPLRHTQRPPSTSSATPVINSASSDAR